MILKIANFKKFLVCTLHVDAENGKLMSGSWDNNAIIWPIHEIVSSSDFNVCLFIYFNYTVGLMAVSYSFL